MNHLSFEWDAKKNALNENKHGVSFEEAKTVFTDQFARLIHDPDHSDEEVGFILLEKSIQSHLLVFCHCIRIIESIRIISARKADRLERKTYEGYQHA